MSDATNPAAQQFALARLRQLVQAHLLGGLPQHMNDPAQVWRGLSATLAQNPLALRAFLAAGNPGAHPEPYFANNYPHPQAPPARFPNGFPPAPQAQPPVTGNPGNVPQPQAQPPLVLGHPMPQPLPTPQPALAAVLSALHGGGGLRY